MQIIPISDPQAIPLAIKELSAGHLVIYPTETCYGIAADTTNHEAVSRLLAYKGDRHRQVAIGVASRAMAEDYVQINPIADNLYTHFLPGPITVISASLHHVDECLESATSTLGVRLPAYPFALDLIKQFGRPITATSANTSGKKEPYSLADWQKYTTRDKQNMVSLFLDAGKLADRPTSTVVDTTLNDPAILRQGKLVIPALAPTKTTTSPEDTQKIAVQILSPHLSLTRRFPLILALQGDLGVGKTQFVKGLASALGIDLTVSSPTYTLLKEYLYTLPKYSGTLYHIDTWRLPDPNELESTIHLSKLLKPGNIVAIEWAGKAESLLKTYEKDFPILVINIKEINVSTRQITYAFSTPEWS
jgi:L-threonylcarbamoyladenylate synthase